MMEINVDLDCLDSTIQEYDNVVENFNAIIATINQCMNDLKASGWDSSASQQYFKTYDDTWLRNMKLYMKIINQLKNNLIIAKEEYAKLEEVYLAYNNSI